MPLFGDNKTERQNDHLLGEVEFRLGVMRIEERKIRDAVRYDLDPARRHAVNGTEEFVALFRHDDELRRSVDDPAHHVVLGGGRFGEHRVQCRDNRHFKP